LTERRFKRLGRIERVDRLGGLLHEYRIVASSCAQSGRRRLAQRVYRHALPTRPGPRVSMV
jgi:hypothetical protein